MKKLQVWLLAVGIAVIPVSLSAAAPEVKFDKYFYNKTLRMDYFHCGDKQSEEFYFDELLEEPYWGGSKTKLIDDNFYGNYYVNVYDQKSGDLIYSRGYNSLFGEWQTVNEATTTRRCCNETVVIPYPKENVRIELMSRNKKGKFEKKFEYAVDINSYFIKKDRRHQLSTFDVHYSGNPANCVDVVLLPEGYTADEMEQFKADCQRFAEGLFTFSPYKENQHKFNIRAVLAPSQEAGSDIPAENIWKNTALSSSFYTFDTDRYIMTYDNKGLRDMAANVPYDFVYIIANTPKYGGGAIYNHYALSVAGNPMYAKIYVHEFGHLFLGLADEYVGGAAYNDLYPLDVEPWEVNITTLVDFDKKWKDLVDPKTPIPTKVDHKDINKIGVYEGAGYVSKGLYRPRPYCLMNSFNVDDFCPACLRAIQKQIDFYTK